MLRAWMEKNIFNGNAASNPASCPWRRAGSEHTDSFVAAGFIAAALSVLLLITIFAYSSARSAAASRLAAQVQALSEALDETVINVLRIQALETHLDFTAPDDAANELEQARQAVQAGLRALDQAVGGRPEHRARAERFRQLVQESLPGGDLHLKTPVEIVWQSTGRSHAVAHRLYATAAEMTKSELDLLAALRHEERVDDHILQACFSMLVMVLMATFYTLYVRIHHNLALQRQLHETHLHAQHQLEERVRERTQALEHANRLLVEENLHRKQAEAVVKECQDAVRQLFSHQEAVKEQERKHIAREVHDGIAQDLYALRMDMCRFQGVVGKSRTRLDAVVRDGIRQVDRLIADVRAVINNVRPEVLDLGLMAAIRWHLNELQRRTRTVYRFSSAIDHVELSERAAVTLFRIVQEATSNITRHAGATEVSVQISLAGGCLHLVIGDNGRGFDAEAARKKGSFGLLGLRERALAIDATVGIVSEEDAGTTVTIEMPLPSASMA